MTTQGALRPAVGGDCRTGGVTTARDAIRLAAGDGLLSRNVGGRDARTHRTWCGSSRGKARGGSPIGRKMDELLVREREHCVKNSLTLYFLQRIENQPLVADGNIPSNA